MHQAHVLATLALAAGACSDPSAAQRDGGLARDDAPACAIDPRPDAASADAPPRKLGMFDGECAGQPGKPRVLVYTYENRFRHEGNLAARALLYELCTTRGFDVKSSNDPNIINSTRLASFDVIVFAVTSGQGMTDEGKADFEAWVHAGGGYVGFEAASATEETFQFYKDNVGADFLYHPPTLERGTVRFENRTHPILEGIPPTFTFVEQWYVFAQRPENVPGLTILMSLDETTLPKSFPAMFKVGYHAYGWAHEKYGGRSFYTALGDNPEVFQDPTIKQLVAQAVEWVAHQR